MPYSDPDLRYIRKSELIATEMDGDLVMMHVESGEYYGISGIGIRVWELLSVPISPAEIVRSICTEFEVDADIARADVQEFLVDLGSRCLIDPA